MHRMRKVMTMVDWDEAAGRRAKGHTIQVVSPQASATGAADQGVTDLVQDGHTWWVAEPRGDRRQAVVYTAAPLRRVEHPLMRWVGEMEEVRVEGTEEVREMAVLRALEWQMDRCAEAEEAEDIREQIRLAFKWVASGRRGEQPRWILAPGTEDGHRKEALETARRLMEEARKPGLGVEDDQGGERPSRWRGMRRGRGGQMRFIVGDGMVRRNGTNRGRTKRGEMKAGSRYWQRAGGKTERREKKGWKREKWREEGRRVLLETGWRRGARGRGQEREVRGRAASGGERRTSRRGVRYGEEQLGCEEQGAVREGMTVYGPHKVSGKWRRYVGTVEEMIEQQDRKRHVTRAAIVQWEDQGEGDEERLPYPVERLQVCPQGRKMALHGQLILEQEARELEGEEVSAGGKNKKRKSQLMKPGAAGKKKKEARRRQGGRNKGEDKGTTDSGDLRVDGEGRWQLVKLYTHNDPAALYRADKAAWQQMKLHEVDPDVVAYQCSRPEHNTNPSNQGRSSDFVLRPFIVPE